MSIVVLEVSFTFRLTFSVLKTNCPLIKEHEKVFLAHFGMLKLIDFAIYFESVVQCTQSFCPLLWIRTWRSSWRCWSWVIRVILEVFRQGGRSGRESLLLSLLLLHSAVLKPYLNLCLVQLERGSNFDSPRSGEILAEVKLFLELCELFGCEIRPNCVLRSQSILGHFSCEEKVKEWLHDCLSNNVKQIN